MFISEKESYFIIRMRLIQRGCLEGSYSVIRLSSYSVRVDARFSKVRVVANADNCLQFRYMEAFLHAVINYSLYARLLTKMRIHCEFITF